MMRRVGEHAVVLGAGVAGLLSARVLADFYASVTIVERDPLTSGGADRKGVPQGRHVHALLPRGASVLDDLFPGLLDELEAGGVPVSRRPDQRWFSFGGHVLSRAGAPDDPAYHPSRPHLEAEIRRRVGGLGNVTLRDGCEAVALTPSDTGDRVTGVRLVPGEGGGEDLPADLVVDATGRGGRTPAWLRQLGHAAPAEEQIAVDVMYASRRLLLRPGTLEGLMQVLVSAEPARPTCMALFAQEDGRHLLTLGGYAGHHPPDDPAGFLAFAESVAPAHVFAAIRDAEPAGEIRRHRFPASRRRRYERLDRFPAGLLVIGDGICSFNPLYGQGMSVAAMEASALHDALAKGDRKLARRFFGAAAKAVDQAWELTNGADFGLPVVTTSPPRSVRVLNAYVRRFQAAATNDPVLTLEFLRVVGLMAPPAVLFKPAVLTRVFFPRPHEAGRRSKGD